MRKLFAPVLLSLWFLAGCSVNPVTGERNLNFYGADWEQNIGQQMYAPMRQSQGGDYIVDPAVASYVQSVGSRLAAQAKRNGQLDFEFHVLNDSTPNAWALPGGKIVINRGLLTELQSEAELAAVLGHEIVHADAAHGARAQSKGVFTQVGMMAAMIYGSSKAESRAGQQVAMMVPQLGAQLITQKYGRDAERESDYYGMQYMSQAGYDPQGAVDLQQTFVKLSEGRRSDWISGLFASHPPSQERVQNNKETAASLPDGGDLGRQRYQQKMAYLKRIAPAYEAHDKARKALAEDKPQEARKLAREALRKEPREALFHALSGDIHASQKRYQQAANAYSAAIKRDSNFFYHYLRRGQVRHELNRFEIARQDLEKSMQLLPTAQGHYLLGNLERRAGRMDSALKHYQAAAQSNSAVGKQAQRELVLMDLPSNPQNYVKTRAQLDSSGNIYALVGNQAPVAVKNIVVRVAWVDNNGQVRETNRQYAGPLAAGQTANLPLRLGRLSDPNQLSQRVRVTISAAQVAE